MGTVNFQQRIHTVIYYLTLLTLIISIAFPVITRDLFFLTSGLAVIAWSITGRGISKSTVWLLIPVFVFGCYRVGYAIYDAGTFRPKLDAWQVYIATGERLIMGTVLAGYLSVFHKDRTRPFLIALMGSLTLCLLYTAYARFYLDSDRAAFAGLRATLITYESVTVYLVFLGCCLQFMAASRLKWIAIGLSTIMAVAVTILTETRAGVLTLIIGISILFLLSNLKHKSRLFAVTGLIFCITVGLSYPMIKPRVEALQADLSAYESGKDRAKSVGARFEMWQASLITVEAAPFFGAGYLGRQQIIQKQVLEKELDPVTVHFSAIHMHNEYLEELSLHGTFGLFLLLLMYGTLFRASLKKNISGERHLALLALVFCYAFFGLADVLFFSREASILFVVLLGLTLTQRQVSQRSFTR